MRTGCGYTISRVDAQNQCSREVRHPRDLGRHLMQGFFCLRSHINTREGTGWHCQLRTVLRTSHQLR